MVEASSIQAETFNSLDPSTTSASVLFHREIKFQLAKKPFKGFSSDYHIETLNPTTSEHGTPSSAMSVTPAKRHDGSEFSEFGLDPELSFGITVRKIGAGLRNLGNTCFLNSVLQCLTHTEPLAAYLQSGKHKSSCHVAGFCALCAIQNHVSRALHASGRTLSPEDLVGNLRCISRNFQNARQEDAHEYMVNLLESMHKCCLPSGVPSESPSAYEKSFVHKIFGGHLRSQVKCQQCSFCSNKFDPFLDLSLEIFKAESLQKALANFTAAEWLDGGERQYNCQRCKQKVRALKQLTVHKAPYVLTIHLKRFHAHNPGQKIKKKVRFDCALDLKPFVSGSYQEGDVKYSLYGVLVHSGSSTHSGHYYCYVRTSNDMWYTLDDNRVYNVSEREVLNQQAYMLFYVRDRKNIVSRKSVDIIKKENGNRDSAAANQVLKGLSNGLAENKSCEPSLNAKAQIKMSNFDSSVVSFTKYSLVQPKSCPSLAGSFVQNKKPISDPSSKEQPHKGSQGGLSIVGLEHECLSTLDNSRKENSLPSCVKSLVDPAGDNTDKNVISKDVKNESLLSALTFSSPQTSAVHRTNGSSQFHKVEVSTAASMCDATVSIECKNSIGCQGLVPNESANSSLTKESVNQKTMKKPKKKFLKYRPLRMHICSSLLLMTVLSSRKKIHKRKKIHRRSKCHNLKKKNMDKLSSNVGPSDDGTVIEKLVEGEFQRRVNQNSAVLATAAQGGNTSSSGSATNQFEGRQVHSLQDGKRDKMHNKFMSIPSRGLEETVVARWDDVELPRSQLLESRNNNPVTIGYVGDEWDEEYDKGKRKKLRSNKPSFGGPNLFQEIATEKSKSKKAKLDQSSSGNLPFRI
ncbi:ubiquitin carboxyl-terminal hydrolase 23 isoform X1 [Arachis hypogaea]|uniref:ubiquitin carboxyl-terminal hydrolase 23 isoform X1 n=1 Tax=Arachis hypogaea TaxID=3818 RepID=UPI000DEC15C5|nr:ubiquitin carboxyl-terminal hydrolase 23 isoform X1 [Arachis hypogaea]